MSQEKSWSPSFKKGEVVCALICQGEERTGWRIGVVKKVLLGATQEDTKYTVSAYQPEEYLPAFPPAKDQKEARRRRHWFFETPTWGRRKRKENTESHEWEVGRCGEFPIPRDSLPVLFSRISSRTFLEMVRSGRLAAREEEFTLYEEKLCKADPRLLLKMIPPDSVQVPCIMQA